MQKLKPKTSIEYFIEACPLGYLLVAMSEKGVCAIMLGDDPLELINNLQNKFPNAHVVKQEKLSIITKKLITLIKDPSAKFNIPLDYKGTEFQQKVWQALKKITLGTTKTYTDIAIQIGSPKAVRAVALACGANPLAIVIPCHRVIKKDGSLSGYRWGVAKKKALLANEAKWKLV